MGITQELSLGHPDPARSQQANQRDPGSLGERKCEADWLEDERCVVERSTLDNRT
jgi:hypothetical protein